ncbi:hypothetical protein JRO89_XS04G0042900 [Xanthoceras sorbifolium]|uniref:Cytochrome b5 heme-binding domain-containing protein n=1 Tax=Xanthoceras sorbifolium TaxID=99658 RepID=A0ABQ8I432_9ROSI|nr:hypothetical protein JRO89_XS04G0042900 [Xanthoceras sorbifolium]
MTLYTTVMDTITTYTGLSLAAFFTIAALMFVVYKTVCGMFVDPEHYDAKKPVAAANLPEPLAISEPVQLGDVKEEELTAYDGSDPKKPILMAIKGQIYDLDFLPPRSLNNHLECGIRSSRPPFDRR